VRFRGSDSCCSGGAKKNGLYEKSSLAARGRVSFSRSWLTYRRAAAAAGARPASPRIVPVPEPGTAPSGPQPWLVIAASSRAAAIRYAEEAGLVVGRVVDRVQLASAGGRIDALAAPANGRRILLHSLDWDREEMPQLYLLALARSRVTTAFLGEGDGLIPRPISFGEVLVGAALAGPQALRGVTQAGVEVLRAARNAPSAPRGHQRRQRRSVVALWPGSIGGDVGGSVTHAAGILGAFKAIGLQVVLITEAHPPPQLVGAVHHVDVLPPLPASLRLTREIRRLASNRLARSAVRRALAQLDDPFIYARHQALTTAAADISSCCGVPLVLEWNASERWAIEHWTRSPSTVKRLVLPIVGLMERRVLRGAELVAAVSAAAAEMAVGAGAAPGSVVIIPNGVDVQAVDGATAEVLPQVPLDGSLRVGWVGSFGEWHGASILVEALARTQSRAHAVMVGDGIEREACEQLAQQLGVADRIVFTGRLSHPQTLQALARCDVLASPHVPLRTGEPFFGSPTKIFEYMALGKPIIASALGQIGDILHDGVSARLVEPGSSHQLAAAIDELAQAPWLRDELGQAARRDAEREHLWESRARVMLSAISA